MELENLPIFDSQLGIKLAGNKKDLAEDLFKMLVNNLPTEIAAIKSSHSAQQYLTLHQKLHQLHGALCYSAAPRLKKIVSHLESEIKQNHIENLPSLLNILDHEVNSLLEYYSVNYIQLFTNEKMTG